MVSGPGAWARPGQQLELYGAEAALLAELLLDVVLEEAHGLQ